MKKSLNPIHKLTVSVAAVAITTLFGIQSAQAGYLFEIDIDGTNTPTAGTFNPKFSFGGDTTSAGWSIGSTAFGATGNSIYGGNGVLTNDTYVFTYDPGVDGDNLSIPAGLDLGGGNLASGKTAGAPDIYAVFTTWPFSENISGGLTTYTATTSGDSFNLSLDQNGQGHEWIKLGEITWSSGPITVTQEAGANTWVSMRSAGLLFEPVPEPSAFALGALGLLALAARRRAANN